MKVQKPKRLHIPPDWREVTIAILLIVCFILGIWVAIDELTKLPPPDPSRAINNTLPEARKLCANDAKKHKGLDCNNVTLRGVNYDLMTHSRWLVYYGVDDEIDKTIWRATIDLDDDYKVFTSNSDFTQCTKIEKLPASLDMDCRLD